MCYKILAVVLFLGFSSVYSQGNNSSVEQVYKNIPNCKLEYTQFSDSITLAEGNQKKGKFNIDFLLLNISRQVQLRFKKFTYNNPSPPFYFRDSLFLYNNKYCIDNLYYEKKVLKSEEPLRLNYATGYTFSFNSKKYLALYFWDSTIPTSNLSYFIILFDVSNQNSIKYYFFDEQMSYTPDCFGDFNNDGMLDFVNWTYGDSIKFMNLNGNKFKYVKNKYIIVKETSSNNYLIDWNTTKWFK